MKASAKNIAAKCAVVLVCMAVNVGGGILASALQLPVWLDCAGTCAAACFAGPAGGIVAGVGGSLLPIALGTGGVLHALIGAAVTLLLCLMVRLGHMEKLTSALLTSFAVGILTAVFTAPVYLIYQNGRCGNLWGNALVDMMDWYGMPRGIGALVGSAVVEIPDKQLCVLIAFLAVRLVRRRRKGERAGAALLSLALLLPSLGALVPAAEASGAPLRAFNGDYVASIFNNNTGMFSSEANDIAETEDGFIWIGSYAGLICYDSKNFTLVREGGIASVTRLFTDREGRLWIGTNDGGFFIRDGGGFRKYTTENGLPANSVRCFAQDGKGRTYIGTTDRLCVLSPEGKISVIDQGIRYVDSLAADGDSILGRTNSGDLFLLEDGVLADMLVPEDKSQYYTCIANTGMGLLAGTSGGTVVRLERAEGRLTVQEILDTGELRYINSIATDRQGRTWLCADTGFGYLDGSESLTVEHCQGFDSSVERLHEDYQGNLWLASSRCGVMKLSENRFSDLFDLAGMEGTVVNAVVPYQGNFYCAADSGLFILDGETLLPKADELAELLAGYRLRSLLVDRENRLWISSFSEYGLICFDPAARKIVSYNAENSDVTGDRFRCAVELQDGTIAAGTSSGISFIRDGQVTGTVTERDGLRNAQILCLTESEDGTLYAGTDGAGIYTLRDGKITGSLTTQDGLSANIIMRMTPYQNGYFVVTSKSLCFLENGKITVLDNFPYFNNYDVLLRGEDAYVLSSSGIYRMNASDLRQNEVERITLLNSKDGLYNGLVANAWNFISEDGEMYLCSNRGVTRFPLDRELSEVPFKMSVTSVTGDGEAVPAEGNLFRIPANARSITVSASLRNYAIINVKLRFFIEELEPEPPVLSQYELEPIQIRNLPHGSYTVRLQLLSENEKQVLQEESCILVKEAQIWENGWYAAYLAVVSVWSIVFLTLSVVKLVNISRRRQQLEILRRELEDTVSIQTEEIRLQAEKMTEFQWSVIESMASLIESRDGNTGLHIANTRSYVALLAGALYERGLYPEVVDLQFVECVEKVAPLHDVGKIVVSDVILNKPGKFTPEEFEIMKEHATRGGEIVESILGSNADPYMLEMAREVASMHHEKWDGSGYPNGLAGEDIPLAARIMAVADVFDALVSKRVYKSEIAPERAFRILEEGSGTHFDPALIEVFLSMKEEIRTVLEEAEEAPD